MLKKFYKAIIHYFPACIGLIIIKLPLFKNYKNELLAKWQDYEKRTKLDNLVFEGVLKAWIRWEYLKEKDPDKREKLKSLVMGGKSGENWAKNYNSRNLDFSQKCGHLSFQEAQPIFDELNGICENYKENSLLVFQIGSSSGREIAYFAKRFPKHRFIGTDIYKEVIEYSSSSHKFPNLNFELISAKNIYHKLASFNKSDIVVFSSGSLQYVQPEHLDLFFRKLPFIPKLKILLLEPGNESEGAPDNLKRSIWRGNFSYTHDYKYYAEKAGFKTIKCRIIKPYHPYEDFPQHKYTIHYYYYGKVNGN